MEIRTDIYLGDCKEELRLLNDDSIDLIVTSPPYADQRTDTYGGIPHDQYVEWFLPVSQELLRVLKPTGTFILNIKEKVVDGERSTYVMELIMEMRKQGWLWTEEFIWHKKNSYPGKWPNRFRDAWERLLDRDKAYPTNVLHLATECSNKSHSAAFPEELPEWFIKLFTKEFDTVLDPFMGSGTTLIVANRMWRHSVGIDIKKEYFEMVSRKIQPVELNV